MVADNKNTIQNEYFAWLSANVSPAQISELHFVYSKIGSFCLYTKVIRKSLFETTDLKTVANIKKIVESNKVFRFKYKNQISKMSVAIRYYYQWIKNNQSRFIMESSIERSIEKETIHTTYDNKNLQIATDAISEVCKKVTTDNETTFLTPYTEILAEKYRKGFRIESGIEMKRFRILWEEKYKLPLGENDEIIRKYIRQITIQYKELVYLPEVMLDAETQQRLLSYVEYCFSEGKKAIYYDSLYNEFVEHFQGQHINNADMLKTYLTSINRGKYVINKSYIACDCNIEVDPVDEVRNYLITLGEPIQTDALIKALFFIPKDKITGVISGSNSAEFVRNQKGEYFHADIVDLTTAELENITDIIQQAIDENDFVGGNELVETVYVKYPTIMERYPYLTQLGMRDAIGYKLRYIFSFKGKIISPLGEELSMADVFANYARSHGYFTLTQLNALKTALDTPIYFDSIYRNSLRISKEDFVSQEQASFDIAATDAAIDRFCVGDYIPINEIRHFGSFPYARFTWNGFLLEHYVSSYSEKYKLMHAGFNASTPVGTIVKRISKFEDFDELIVSVLANSMIALNKQDALQYLYDNGFLARRSYGTIEQILFQANVQRLQKG